MYKAGGRTESVLKMSKLRWGKWSAHQVGNLDVCVHIYIYIRTHIHTHPYVYRYDYIHLYIYVCTLVENLTNKNIYNIIMCVHIYTNVYIQLHLTNSAISTYKVEKENVRRNNVHSRCPFIARLECIVCIPFSLMCLGKQQ